MAKGGYVGLIVLFALAVVAAVALAVGGAVAAQRAARAAGGAPTPETSLQPCTVEVPFASLPAVETNCCPASTTRRLGTAGGGVPFVLDAYPVAGLAACSTLCAEFRVVAGPRGATAYECRGPTPDAQAAFEACRAAVDSAGVCNGVAKPVGTAGTVYLYAQGVAGPAALQACVLPCAGASA